MSVFRNFFKVGSVEILRFLDTVGEARHNKILNQNFVESRETFARRLRELEELELIKRKILHLRPPGVSYSLTKKGKRVIILLNDLEEIL
ncbi:MAG: winged helix-turn-helix transcriptional regulator [Candidatus Hydrothermarchaeales archaeon]